MEHKFNTLALALALMLVSAFSMAATEITAFDSVTSYRMAETLSGIEKDTGNPVSITFGASESRMSLCTPLVLTAMEKPGRYYLYVAVESNQWNSSKSFKYCTLQLKPILE